MLGYLRRPSSCCVSGDDDDDDDDDLSFTCIRSFGTIHMDGFL
jgi:hypothetical protein